MKDKRRDRAMTQLHLAQAADIDARTVRKIEKGERVSPESLSAVCAVLFLDPALVLAEAVGRSEADVAPPRQEIEVEAVRIEVVATASRAVGRILAGSGLVAACACLVVLVQALLVAGDSQMYLGKASSIDLSVMAGRIKVVVDSGPDGPLPDDPDLARSVFRSSMVVREGERP